MYLFRVFSFTSQNLPAELKWPEVNQRVLYPIKEVLVGMENRLLINRHDPISQFCVSFITLNVVNVGIERVVAAWNAHPIEGFCQKKHAVVDIYRINSHELVIRPTPRNNEPL